MSFDRRLRAAMRKPREEITAEDAWILAQHHFSPEGKRAESAKNVEFVDAIGPMVIMRVLKGDHYAIYDVVSDRVTGALDDGSLEATQAEANRLLKRYGGVLSYEERDQRYEMEIQEEIRAEIIYSDPVELAQAMHFARLWLYDRQPVYESLFSQRWEGMSVAERRAYVETYEGMERKPDLRSGVGPEPIGPAPHAGDAIAELDGKSWGSLSRSSRLDFIREAYRAWLAQRVRTWPKSNPRRAESVVLIGCTKNKAPLKRGKKVAAQELYSVSPLFTKSRRYAEALIDEGEADDWAILSAKFGLTPRRKKIPTYNETLVGAKIDTKRAWAKRVAKEILKVYGDRVHLIFLTSKDYARVVDYLPETVTYEEPLEGLGIGDRMRWLDGQI